MLMGYSRWHDKIMINRETNKKSIPVESPLSERVARRLMVGDKVNLSGVVYVARDAAHHRLVETLEKGEEPPLDIEGQTFYYMGPSPAPPGRIIGSAGPTTSSRMDQYTPYLVSKGLRAMIGKGSRSGEVREALKLYGAIYFVAVGGAGALISMSIKEARVVAYEDLGPEAILRLTVKDFPLIVANDVHGGDLFSQNQAIYRR